MLELSASVEKWEAAIAADGAVNLAMMPVQSADSQDGFKMLSAKTDEVTGYVVASGICLAAVVGAGVAIRSMFRKATDFSQGKTDQTQECLL